MLEGSYMVGKVGEVKRFCQTGCLLHISPHRPPTVVLIEPREQSLRGMRGSNPEVEALLTFDFGFLPERCIPWWFRCVFTGMWLSLPGITIQLPFGCAQAIGHRPAFAVFALLEFSGGYINEFSKIPR